MDVPSLSTVLLSQPASRPPAFPAGWRRTPIGKLLYGVMRYNGWANWGEVPDDHKARFRHLYALLAKGSLPFALPASEAAVRRDPLSSAEIGVGLPVEVHLPQGVDLRSLMRAVVTSSPSQVDIDEALIGDKLHGLCISIVSFSKSLKGPARNEWFNHYASNKHMCQYLCALLGVPMPTSNNAIHNGGTYFEKFFQQDRKFRRDYLLCVFGPDMERAVRETLSTLL